MKTLAAVAVLVLTAVANAQSTIRGDLVDPKSPRYSWMSACLTQLKKSGILVGYPIGMIHGNRPPTRFEYAVADHATYVHVQNILRSVPPNLKKEDDQTVEAVRQCLPCLEKLTLELSPELVALGVDVPNMLVDLRNLAGDKVISFSNVGVAKIADAQWLVKKYALLIGWPSLSPDKSGWSYRRADLALTAYNVYAMIDAYIAKTNESDSSADFDSMLVSVEFAEYGAKLQTITKPYFSDLGTMGVDTKQMQQHIASWKEQIEKLWSADNLARLAKEDILRSKASTAIGKSQKIAHS